MKIAMSDSRRPHRLNPLAFPSETDMRFRLFIVAVLALAMSISLPLYYIVVPENQQLSQTPTFNGPPVDTPDDVFFQAYLVWALPAAQRTLLALSFPAGLLLAIFALASVLYWLHPLYLQRQGRLRLLTREAAPALQRETRSLARQVGLKSLPTLLLGPAQKKEGQAFGFPNRYLLRLDGGLQQVLQNNPGAFRALVLHELAHLVNGDVGRGYFAKAAWTATFWLATIALMLGVIWLLGSTLIEKIMTGTLDIARVFTVNLPAAVSLLAQGAGATWVVKAAYASLLRVRETFADWRAAQWGAEPMLVDILTRTVHREKTDRGWLKWWRVHPTARQRLEALQRPDQLFRMSPELPLLSGALVAFGVSGIAQIVLSLLLLVSQFFTSLVASAALSESIQLARALIMVEDVLEISGLAVPLIMIAGALVNTLGLQVVREAVADAALVQHGLGRYLRLWAPATLFAIGFEIGCWIVPMAWFAPKDVWTGLLVGLWWLVFVTLTWFGLVIARFIGQRAFASHTRLSAPIWKHRLLMLILNGLLAVFVGPMLALRVLLMSGQMPELVFVVTVLVIGFGGAGLSLLTLGLAQGLLWVWQVLLPIHCPACRKTTRHSEAIGKSCEHCGQLLTPWMFVTSSSNA